MLICSPEDFEPTEFGQALYYPRYERFPYFAERAELLVREYLRPGERVLVAGCGWGFLVDELLSLRVDAYGLDISGYAERKYHEHFAGKHDRFLRADVCSPQQMQVGFVVTEDLLPCLTDPEVEQALKNLRTASDRMLHFVSCGPGGAGFDPRLNWKSLEQWQAVVADDPVVAT